MKITLTILLSILVSSCASINKADHMAESKAKQFRKDKKHAQIYIYRNEFMGAISAKDIVVNGDRIGETGPGSFFFLTVKPGDYTISSEDGGQVLIEAKKGKQYFVWQEMKMGMFYPLTKIQRMGRDHGIAGVSSSKMIKSDKDFK